MNHDPIYNSLIKRLERLEESLPLDLRSTAVTSLLALSLLEDLFPDDRLEVDPDENLTEWLHAADITSAAALTELGQLRAQIIAKQAGIIAGLPVAEVLFRCLDFGVDFQPGVEDGQAVFSGDVVAEIEGNGRGLLTAERTALDFLGVMSGTATLVGQFVQQVRGTGAQILDTRKTIPGHRQLQKYAVRMGGGTNHRMGLYDMILIKDNHIDGAGGIEQAVVRVRRVYGDRYPIEVEVKDLAELRTALALDLDRILLDNMNLDEMRRAVVIAAGKTSLEASGNVRLENVRQIAETGVDFISVGALTHSAPNFDLSMRIS